MPYFSKTKVNPSNCDTTFCSNNNYSASVAITIHIQCHCLYVYIYIYIYINLSNAWLLLLFFFTPYTKLTFRLLVCFCTSVFRTQIYLCLYCLQDKYVWFFFLFTVVLVLTWQHGINFAKVLSVYHVFISLCKVWFNK